MSRRTLRLPHALGAAALAALLAAAAACGSEAAQDEPGAAPPPGTWQLVDGRGPGGPVEPPEGHPITLAFEAGDVGGRAACNSYGGAFELDGDRFRVGDVVQTEMACEPAVMAAEAAYTSALRAVDRLRREGDRLVLTGPSTELRFAPLPPVPERALTGTRWELDTVIAGDVASSVVAPAATLVLHADGRLEGGTGCRPFTGRYVVRGAEVVVSALTVHDDPAAGACAEAAVEQERVVLAVLERPRAEVEGDRLTLTGPGGQGLGFRAG